VAGLLQENPWLAGPEASLPEATGHTQRLEALQRVRFRRDGCHPPAIQPPSQLGLWHVGAALHCGHGDPQAGRGQAVGLGDEGQLARRQARPYDHLAPTVEQVPLCGHVRFVAHGVAIAYAQDLTIADQRKAHQVAGRGHGGAIHIHGADLHRAGILAIGAQERDAAGQLQSGGPTRRFGEVLGDRGALAFAQGLQHAPLIGHLPARRLRAVDGLLAKGTPVEVELHALAVGITPHLDGLTLTAGPVPVRQDVHHGRVVGPQSAAQPGIVLGVATRIQYTAL